MYMSHINNRLIVSHLCRSNTLLLNLSNHHNAVVRQRLLSPVGKKLHFSTSTTTTTATTTSTSSSKTVASPSWLEGDIGALGTTIYHTLNIGLAVITPIYFLTPERYTNGYISKTIGFGIASAISLHTYIGLNYVCRDYVPKLSSKLLGPARIVTAGFSFILLVGMSKIALYSPNGIKGLISGLWIKKTPLPPKE